MSNFIAGDVEEVTIIHPTLGTFRFYPKAKEAYTLDRGGIRNADDSNGVTGSGQVIRQKNRVGWYFEGSVAVDFAADTELNALDQLTASPVESVCMVSHISGALYKGTGSPIGDLNVDTDTGLLKLKVGGGGKLVKI